MLKELESVRTADNREYCKMFRKTDSSSQRGLWVRDEGVYPQLSAAIISGIGTLPYRNNEIWTDCKQALAATTCRYTKRSNNWNINLSAIGNYIRCCVVSRTRLTLTELRLPTTCRAHGLSKWVWNFFINRTSESRTCRLALARKRYHTQAPRTSISYRSKGALA